MLKPHHITLTKMISRACKTFLPLSVKIPLLRKPPVLYSVPRFSFSTSSPGSIKLCDYLVNQHQFSPESALKASSSSIKYLKKPEKSDSILSFLKESGFSKSQIEKTVERYPRLLFCNLDKSIKPKIKIFRDLGFSPTDVAEIVSVDPWILSRSVDNGLQPAMLVLEGVLGSKSNVSKVLKISGGVLKSDLRRTLLPNIEFMKSCGISSSQVVKYILNFPRFFLNKPESIEGFVRRVDEMGFDRRSKMFLPAIRVVGSMSREKWEFKLKVFKELGFSEKHIFSMFRRAPQVFGISEKKIKDVTQFFLSTGNSELSLIVRHPGLLICSIEQRLKPRLKVINVLESKNLLRRQPSLSTICKMSNQQFLDRYVIPYSNELGDLYMTSWSS